MPQSIEERRAACREYRQKNRAKILARKRQYWRENKARLMKEQRDWWYSNPEKVAAIRKRYEKKERARYAVDPEWRRKRRQLSIDHATQHPEWYRAWAKMDRERNPGKYENYRNTRRARKLGAAVGTDREAYKQFVKVLKRSESLPCYWCGKDTTPGHRHIDHIIPLARGGKDDVFNLCCACPKCNRVKSNRPPEVFSGQFVLPF